MRGILAVALLLAVNAENSIAQPSPGTARFRLITLDPGHFHAALIQEFMYADVDPVVHVYAPAGEDLREHLRRIENFNSRSIQPTHWREKVYSGPDFLEKMLAEKPGNVVVIAGNNLRKTDYILRSAQAGLNVLADKPMAITPGDFEKLKLAFAVAATNRVLICDIMTERHEIATELQRELSRQGGLFGKLKNGSPDHPAVEMESVHYFSKTVAGVPLKRPQWFFDVRQEGEAITDVATHLVDLVQWECFPGQASQPADVKVFKARHWPTALSLEQFRQLTGAQSFPDFLQPSVRDGTLQILANGEFTYELRGVIVKVTARWDFAAAPGSGDTHFSILRGTGANLVIRQGPEQEFKPTLFVENTGDLDDATFEVALKNAVEHLQNDFPGVGYQRDGKIWRVTIPDKYQTGHEAHFAQVTEDFLGYLRAGQLPSWEAPNMITKYATIMQAYELTR